MNGWTGKILKIDLNSGKQEEIKIERSLYRKYLGGRGLGVKLYTQICTPETDPLSPENALIFMTGPVTGTVLTSGRYQVISKSPLTGTICDSSSGGVFGERLKSAGFDGFIIIGKSDHPIYLHLNENGFTIKNAGSLWGQNTHKTRDWLTKELSPKISVASIGPAGENQVLFAAIMNDNDRAAGRGGMGTIMGSKNLKAIAVQGEKKVTPRYPEKLKNLEKKISRLVDKNPITGKALKLLGTSVLVNIMNAHGILPTKNFQKGIFNDAEGISGEKLLERFVHKKSSCYKCPIACGRSTKTDSKSGEGPEYETVWSFGAQLNNNDLTSITHANYLCNELGMDTISTGNTIGCAMELSELGLLPEKISWGDSEKILGLVNDIAYKRGIGKELALGSKRLSKKYNKPNISMQVKGMELPAYDPRGALGQGLAYATSNRGGCHMKAFMIGPEILGQPVFMDRFSYAGKAEIVGLMQDIAAFVDSMILCRFLQFPFSISTFAEILNYVTGYDFSEEELLNVGKRIFTLERDFNIKAGFERKDDTLPHRFFYEQLEEGPSRNKVVELDRLLDDYYFVRGWDKNGIPKKSTLDDLGIHYIR